MRNQILHKNSQKRFYNSDYIYFITTVTHKRFSYFSEEIFCDLFIDNLRICKQLKDFKLYGFIIVPDHAHLLIKSGEKFNISEKMFSIKKQFSHDVNRVLGFNEPYPENVKIEGGQTFARLQWEKIIFPHQKRVNKYREQFINKYGHDQFQIPPFKWQESFRDHVIRNEKDFLNHLNYIFNNCVKHNIYNNPETYHWSFCNEEFKDLIDDYFGQK
ncbi:MAG: transposase [Patescibacteria group bacterium]|nr:transposase [Patescibacteria group bacterium]MDD4611227.1 transposase [Patescibacteria group bacterium]